MADYPTSITSLTNPAATDPTNNPSHALQHSNANDEIEAIETELGTDVAGSATDLKTRLAVEHEDDGTHKAITCDSLISDATTGYVKVNSLTTTQRNALTAANGMIIYNSTDNQFEVYENGSWETISGGGGASSTKFDDSTFGIQDNVDDTKEIAFQASGITTGNTRTITMADEDVSLAGASTTVKSLIEIATQAEVDTGTDTSRAVVPDTLAGSVHGEKIVEVVVTDYTVDVATGDGQGYFHIPTTMNGMNLVEVHAEVITTGITNTTDIQIHNVTQAADMLSTKLTIDSTESGSDTAATPAVIDTSNDDVATNDLIRIDVDQVSTTAPEGLIVSMVFRLP